MENKKPGTMIKSIVLIASWLTLSPLLLILDGRWKLLPKWLRIVLFLLSPMIIVVLALVVLWGIDYYPKYYMQHHFVKCRVVENITGVRLPRYKVVDRGEEWVCFGRSPEHTYDFTLEFKKTPDGFEPGKYSYSAIWGNGIEAPKGESDKDDNSFSIDIERGSKTFHIRVGEW